MALPARRIRRRITLTEIAEACGVVPSTVSRALSNPNRVSPQMYERVVRKAKELGYDSATLPDTRSRISRGTTALLLPNLTNPFNLDLIRGSQRQAQAAGFMQLLVTSEESEQVEADWLAELAQTVDGVIVVGPRSDDALLAQVAERVPLVVLNREVPRISGVLIDTPAGMAQGLDYLVSLGHRRIAYVRGPSASWSDRTRLDALHTAADRHEAELVAVGAFHPTLAAGAAAADAVALTGVTAAIFFNDTLAIGALGRFRHCGTRVPEDLSIIGCDDVFGASFTHPPLTTVQASGEQAGRAVTDILLGGFLAKDRAHRVDRIPTHLLVRESTGPPPPEHE
ncbi:LacI family DNA-binding transcriptional regulator [Saccharopolyspora sp. 6M]|uniref:LacI family DNA-binding transcriptional regulator n=1 Tax=Saccharopolyspora sp. 6M TaxID=2877237 RepID=UPI001CD32EAD|nr:LacI family DNA-binding transcriptional regulator [Saccharopolyspora sp. 6M]MCA1228839.1 LacI family transcriptional regulator [Saccharopolyspora sp. 6M]